MANPSALRDDDMRKDGKDAKQVVVELRPARAKATLAELLLGWIRKPVKVRVKR